MKKDFNYILFESIQKGIYNGIESYQAVQQVNIENDIYINIFRKIGIYNKNTKLINEGYTKLSNNIIYTINEQKFIVNILELTQQQLVNQLCEGISDNIKKSINKDKLKEYIQKIKDSIPNEILNAYNLLCKGIQNGIKTVKDLLNIFGKLLTSLGENIIDALEKLGLYKDTVVNNIPETTNDNLENIQKLLPNDKNKQKVLLYIINATAIGITNPKNIQLNEGKTTEFVKDNKEKVIAGGIITSTLVPGVLPIALLAGGGYGLYKLFKYAGPKLSDRLEPYLLSDKAKEFAQKLYNNKFARISLGLNLHDDSNDSKLKKFGKIIWSILINFVIATLISSIITLFVSTVITTGPWCGVIVASIIAGKNIFRTIINRILNFKKTSVGKNGKSNINIFFDAKTLIGIFASVASVIVQIPGLIEWINSLFAPTLNMVTQTIKADNLALSEFIKQHQDLNNEVGNISAPPRNIQEILKEFEKMPSDPNSGKINSNVTSILKYTSEETMINNNINENEVLLKFTHIITNSKDFGEHTKEVLSTIVYSNTSADNIVESEMTILYSIPGNETIDSVKYIHFDIETINNGNFEIYSGYISKITGKIITCTNKENMIGKNIEELIQSIQ